MLALLRFRLPSWLPLLLGITTAVFAGALTPRRADAATITLGGESDLLDMVLEREGGLVPTATFFFAFAPPPSSDATLTVVAAGDLGHRVGEPGPFLDYITVSALGSPNVAVDGKTLFKDTLSNCDYFAAEGGEGFHETYGFRINADGTLKLVGGSEVPCGPSWHSVDTSTEAFPFGVDGDTTVKRMVTHAVVPGTDSITISKDTLEGILAADPGRIILMFTPNPGGGGSDGPGRVRYISATLTYEAADQVPEPASTLLFVTALIGGAVAYRRRSSAERSGRRRGRIDFLMALIRSNTTIGGNENGHWRRPRTRRD